MRELATVGHQSGEALVFVILTSVNTENPADAVKKKSALALPLFL